jgi:S-sulfo-L-cysteine synthase (O-acetyl-L-serine-dependent)
VGFRAFAAAGWVLVSCRVQMTVKTRLLDQIGNTPLIKLDRLCADLPGIEIWVKLEFFNPGGSVKDRPALNIIESAERSGDLAKDSTPVGATFHAAAWN